MGVSKIENNWERHVFIVPYPGLGALLTLRRNQPPTAVAGMGDVVHSQDATTTKVYLETCAINSSEILSQGICLKFIIKEKLEEAVFGVVCVKAAKTANMLIRLEWAVSSD